MNFNTKSYGAIFTDDEANIELIRNIIREMDEFEFGYLPKDMIRVFNPRIRTIGGEEYISVNVCYTHKFDALDLNALMLRCWKSGIRMWYIIGDRNDEYVGCFVKKPKGYEE